MKSRGSFVLQNETTLVKYIIYDNTTHKFHDHKKKTVWNQYINSNITEYIPTNHWLKIEKLS